MTKITKFVGFLAVCGLLAGPRAAVAYGLQPFDNPWNLCALFTQKQERAQRIPHRLLKAISLAESGRWIAGTGEISAWPWTVMAQGEGRFFEDKLSAIAWVRELQAKGVENIDVGCMQVNLYYHGHAFPSLDHAFDPEFNTRYAAEFLRKKYRETGSWTLAAGHYHSSNPEKNTPYREKVFRFWTGSAAQPAPASVPVSTASARAKENTSPSLKPRFWKARAATWRAKVDHDRTKALNARLQSRRSGQPDQAPAQTTPGPDRRLQMAGRSNARTAVSFAERRRAQLQRWRQTRSWNNRAVLR